MTEDKKIVLVTGGTKGIGLATSQRLARDASNQVVINSHRELADDEKEALLASFANPVEVVTGDVSKEEDAKRMIDDLVSEYGHIDVLVNNAGMTQDKLMTRMTETSFKDVLNTNLVGTFNMSKYALKAMQKKRFGVIINMSSIAGIHGNMGQANYSASKAGIIGLTKTTAQEGSLRGVRCNAIAPGMIKTAMTDKLSDKIIKQWTEQIPLHRFGNPDNIAETVEFLIKNDYITGQVITVDGGLTM
ncbi:beta-ketoacyl-ACP reductase [Fructilactobacillus lindneri]|uniref:3-oxoacyl-ACP reductase n=2 Tax=Fructilactobacillus lindneri TaxID=53444 RepID=A0A0R2JNJ5_9LACO|nr:3-oxoacyl-ACP reductase FabG [Fructilactobacillus lindneri]ANZ57803.1 beta-ketoacyl-ACP reductase [Fructilactobacillus lindneri]ANZ59072.1 beta-ketoacyl-ACP reductase [Fructilactobacillus lindneri]KRN78750.1 3-oxoacyl-ACP reductase [Fructilactobacillus lindneri DSM 20690 = JCM 11027]POG98126.1 beta-ketoacyl-ACP reductase [Fructilactobacillus lindneri]POH01759.1 beta-ketoacyl-ACP reductase [Fructilactobacillus lindneri]